VLLVCGVPVAALALSATRLHVSLPRGNWLPPAMESTRGLGDLAAMGRSAIAQTVRLVVTLPDSVDVFSDAGWQAVAELTRVVDADSSVGRVYSLQSALGPFAAIAPRELVLASIPPEWRDAFVSGDRHATFLEVIPREGAEQPELDALARRLRDLDTVVAREVPGARVLAGGILALNIDYQHAVAGRFLHVVAIVVGATLIVLAVGLRSIIVPLKAVALNLLAVAAAFGAVTLVFQDGIGRALVGLDAPLDGVFAAIPTLVFCIVFGLSMDYEVFLIARVREARAAGRSEADAIAEGVARTGGVITSAAAIMVVVFGAFTFGEFLPVKMLGFGLATAVFLDATVMRLALSPALLALAGRWNWWPGERR
jgi:RND superfamily putative drug exporter